MRRPVLIFYGPTAVGKTDFAESIAAAIKGEILNADLGQFYTALTIGTAKPDWKNSPIPQHLFDTINGPYEISVADYRAQALEKIKEIQSRGVIPCITGGSVFYIRSLFFPPEPHTSSKAIQLPAHVQGSWDLLNQIDPERAGSIHPNDTYRITRALTIFYATGKKPSECLPKYQPLGPFILVYLTRNKDALYRRINQRVKLMLEEGWIEEVKNLDTSVWREFLKKKKIIGYDDILEYLESANIGNMEPLIETIAQKTRNYAKRQMTFGSQLFHDLKEAIAQTNDSYSLCVQYDLSEGSVDTHKNNLMSLIRSMMQKMS